MRFIMENDDKLESKDKKQTLEELIGKDWKELSDDKKLSLVVSNTTKSSANDDPLSERSTIKVIDDDKVKQMIDRVRFITSHSTALEVGKLIRALEDIQKEKFVKENPNCKAKAKFSAQRQIDAIQNVFDGMSKDESLEQAAKDSNFSAEDLKEARKQDLPVYLRKDINKHPGIVSLARSGYLSIKHLNRDTTISGKLDTIARAIKLRDQAKSLKREVKRLTKDLKLADKVRERAVRTLVDLKKVKHLNNQQKAIELKALGWKFNAISEYVDISKSAFYRLFKSSK